MRDPMTTHPVRIRIQFIKKIHIFMYPDEKSCNLVSATGIFVYTSPDGTKENVFPVRSGSDWEWYTINTNSGGGFGGSDFGTNSGGSPFQNFGGK